MSETNSRAQLSIPRLILMPGVITLAVTVLRLVGELEHWSKTWFNPEQGGFLAVVGIVWLAPVFGIYFALKLSRAGQGAVHLGHAIAHAILGAILLAGGLLSLQRRIHPRLAGGHRDVGVGRIGRHSPMAHVAFAFWGVAALRLRRAHPGGHIDGAGHVGRLAKPLQCRGARRVEAGNVFLSGIHSSARLVGSVHHCCGFTFRNSGDGYGARSPARA